MDGSNLDGSKEAGTTLATLRGEIDRIDEAMHELLMERGRIIDRLIATKGTAASGAAFRPDREASMMRALAERHGGLLPLDTAEGIWRVIIATFTFVQAPFSVHADVSGGDAAMRDCARFHFGFTVPYRPASNAADVVEAVATSRGDLGLVRIDGGVAAGPWWDTLARPGRPRIIARLPFIERPQHPAGISCFVLSRPLEGPGAREVVLYAAALDRWPSKQEAGLADAGIEILGSTGTANGLSMLLAAPAALKSNDLAAALGSAATLVEVGSHAERFKVEGPDRPTA